MKNEQDIREILISNTISLIAEGGFERATTKAITYSGNSLPNVKLNEAYIYRLFGDKEHLYEKAFEKLDKEFFNALYKCVQSFKETDETVKEKLYGIFLQAWYFLLKNEARCRCYIRYYYSVYFKGESLASHNRNFNEIVSSFAPLFKDEADVKSIMHSVFTAMFDFAIRVYNCELEDSDINRPHIFNVLYCMMAIYFRESVKIS